MDRRRILTGIGLICLAGCSKQLPDAALAAKPEDRKLPLVQVFKNVGCGCCDLWVEHLKGAGFTATVQEMADRGPLKARVGSPPNLASCHTAEVDGYFLEGHVPVVDVIRLLKERPTARGLAVPGMPLGSPGMEVEGHGQAYDVLLVAADGSSSVFAHHAAQELPVKNP